LCLPIAEPPQDSAEDASDRPGSTGIFYCDFSASALARIPNAWRFGRTAGAQGTSVDTQANPSSETGVTAPAPRDSEFKESVSAIESELNGNLQVLSAHVSNAERAQRETLGRLDALFADWGQRLRAEYASVQQQYDGVRKQYDQALQQVDGIQRRYDGVQQQFKGVQHQYDGIRQEFEAVRQFAQGLAQRLEATQQQCQVVLGFEPQFQGHAQTIQGFEQRLAGNAARFTELAASIEEEGRRRSNVEISIGEFSQEIGKKSGEIVQLTEEVATLRRAVSSGRRRERLAIAASVVALLAAGYVGLGKPGWPLAASYAAVQPAK
jgi:predicted  nucleic acid-binding Zn-ribbon protein